RQIRDRPTGRFTVSPDGGRDSTRWTRPCSAAGASATGPGQSDPWPGQWQHGTTRAFEPLQFAGLKPNGRSDSIQLRGDIASESRIDSTETRFLNSKCIL